MPLSALRISADIEAIAAFSESAGVADRPTFSASWQNARDYIAAEATAAGCQVRIDAAGNLHARPSGASWERAVWLSGSHIDSVPTGGKFDGVVGVVVALECLRAAAEDGRRDLPLELIVFAEEEGTTFGLGMIGSRLWTGTTDLDTVSRFRNRAGQTYFEAGAPCGVSPERIAAERLSPQGYLAFVEVHIEQGPTLWTTDQSLAVVRAIAGRKQYTVSLAGVPNHAGSTPMNKRSDALAAAARIITGLESMARKLSDQTVATVGQIECEPNAVNVIPGRVRFTIDFRSPDECLLAEGHTEIERLVRAGDGALMMTEDQPPVRMDAELCNRLHRAAADPLLDAASGALHDAAVVAPLLPTAMLFVASKDGISHNPAEFSRIEDIVAAGDLLYCMLNEENLGPAVSSISKVKASLADLNSLGRTFFVSVCGPLFEHSPWIAQRTWPSHPFENLHALHESLCLTMHAAAPDEQIALIAAHPDLVGKMALEETLSPESAGEQAGAGLNYLTDEEATIFKRFNAAYGDKFGFPFVICARENKKPAILAAFPMRMENTREQEIQTALAEIAKIAWLRLLDAVSES